MVTIGAGQTLGRLCRDEDGGVQEGCGGTVVYLLDLPFETIDFAGQRVYQSWVLQRKFYDFQEIKYG